ncbi:SRPBCC family protein [Nonomuraea sp. K274]|uniref:SRPBCC family protein n=1 Tax=Nonomuraea cypriaca TaxID=1187855 RepID=A0A931AGG9_9ACTN|nr:SRPBCC family protein [Nonomuraea cypriaca]MBF8191533.1 SRPBCC family protein [Nonomuraea cypriaca]
MTTRVLKATVAMPAADLIERLGDELAFPAYAADLVSVSDVGDGLREWVLAFRGGTATWVQRSRRAEPYRIEFEQVGGDFQHLKGAWTATGREAGYEVSYGTSVPHLAGAIDSAAGRVLIRTAHQIMSAVAGPARVTAGGHLLRDLPATPSPA